MSRINAALDTHTNIEWILRNKEQIKTHPAWKGNISENDAEALLRSKDTFTYLLRCGNKEYSYCLSFIQEGGFIKHKSFILELDRKGWYYRNGSTSAYPHGIIEEDINQLIPLMMGCDRWMCRSC